jgi:hypothetical protein
MHSMARTQLLGRIHWVLVALFVLQSTNQLAAQEYLGQMSAADCRQRGGAPDSSITDENNPDPPRGCWRHFTTGSQIGGSAASGGNQVTTTTNIVTAGETNTAAIALQVGGQALIVLGQIIEALDTGDSEQQGNQVGEQNLAQVEAIKEQEKEVLRQEAHRFNEEGRAAAAQGRTVVAMLNFENALDRADQINDLENLNIYRDNMNTMRAYIAYDTGLRAWRNRRYDAARKSFAEAISYAQMTSDNHLAQNISKGIRKLPADADSVNNTAPEVPIACSLINGQTICN